MGAIAGKTMLENNANLGILFAYSGQNVSQNYKIGGGGYIGDQNPHLTLMMMAFQMII